MRKFITVFFLMIFLLPFAGCYERSGVVVSYGPPPPRIVGFVGHPPGPDFVWVDGFWRWSGRNYYWVPGYWVRRPHHNAVWVSGYWTQRRSGWVWVEGRW